MPRGRFNYSRFGGFSGYGGEMGDPASSTGGQALSKMTRQSAPRPEQDDPLWNDIEGTFQDILGEYANMDLDMPIQPPDMNDPQDQMRYLKDLESLGMSSAPSAALMGKNISAAMELITAQSKQQKDAIEMLMKVAPLVADNPDMSAFIGFNILNTMFPGQLDVQDKGSSFWPGEVPGVTRLTPENALEGELYEGLKTNALPLINEFFEQKDEVGLNELKDQMVTQLKRSGMSDAVIKTIIESIYDEAKTGYLTRRIAARDRGEATP